MTEELGLDTTLLRINNHRGADQSHLSVVVRGSRNNYLMDAYGVTGVSKPVSNQKGEKERTAEAKKSLEKSQYLFIPDIINNIQALRRPKGVLDFLRTGQILSKYHVSHRLKDNGAIPSKIRRGFKYNGELMLRKPMNSREFMHIKK